MYQPAAMLGRTGASRMFALLLLGAVPGFAGAQAEGPPRGTLVVSGGAETTSHIIDRFVDLAGGPDAPIVIIPTSGRSGKRERGTSKCFTPGIVR